MGRIRFTHNSFATGLINKRVQGNTEFEQYNNALRECLNANVLPTGGIQKRAGSKFLSYLDSQNTRLLSLSYSVEESYILALSTYSLEIFTKYGKLDIPGGKVHAIFIVPRDKAVWYIEDINTLTHKTLQIEYPAEVFDYECRMCTCQLTGAIFIGIYHYPSSYNEEFYMYKIDKDFTKILTCRYSISPVSQYLLFMRIVSTETFGRGILVYHNLSQVNVVLIENNHSIKFPVSFEHVVSLCDGVSAGETYSVLVGGGSKLSVYTENGARDISQHNAQQYTYVFHNDYSSLEKIYFSAHEQSTPRTHGIYYYNTVTKKNELLFSYNDVPTETPVSPTIFLFSACFLNELSPFGIMVMISGTKTKVCKIIDGKCTFLTDFTLSSTELYNIFCSVNKDTIIISERKPTNGITKSMVFMKVAGDICYCGTFHVEGNINDDIGQLDQYQSTMFLENSSSIPVPFLWDTIEYIPYIQNNNITFFFADTGIYVFERLGSDQFKFFKYNDPFSIPPLTFLNDTNTTLTPKTDVDQGSYTITINEGTFSFSPDDVGSYLVFLYTLDARLYTIYLAIDTVKTSNEVVAHIDNDLSSSPNINKDGQLLLPNTRKVGNWQIGCMNDTRGWPTAAALFEGRLFLCNTKSYATGIWGSNLAYNDLLNFAIDSTASSGLQARIKIENCSTILWLVGINKLFLGTVGGICVIGSGTYQDEGLSPGKFVARFFDSTRPSPLPPVKVKDAIFFVDNSGTNVYEIVLDSQLGAYKANNVSLLSNEYTSWGIISHAFLQVPYNSYWCVLKNGELCSFTYQKNNNVLAWSRHKIGGNSAIVTSVACMPFENKDHLFLVVTRLINQQQVTTLEYISPPFNPITDDAYKQHFCDSYISFENRVAIKNIIKNKPSRIKSGSFPLYKFLPVQGEYDAIFLLTAESQTPLYIRAILTDSVDRKHYFFNLNLASNLFVKDTDISQILQDKKVIYVTGSGTNIEKGITLVSFQVSGVNAGMILRTKNFIEWEDAFSFTYSGHLYSLKYNLTNMYIPQFIYITKNPISRIHTVFISTDGLKDFKEFNFPYSDVRIWGVCDIPGQVLFPVWDNGVFIVSTTNFTAFDSKKVILKNYILDGRTNGTVVDSLYFDNKYYIKITAFVVVDSTWLIDTSTNTVVFGPTQYDLDHKIHCLDIIFYQKLIYTAEYENNSSGPTPLQIKIFTSISKLQESAPLKTIQLEDVCLAASFKILNGILFLLLQTYNTGFVLARFDPSTLSFIFNRQEAAISNVDIASVIISDFSTDIKAENTALACKPAPFKLKNFNLDSFEIYRQFTPKGPLIGFDYSTFESMYPQDAVSTISKKTKYYCGIKLTNVTKLERDHITAKTDKLEKNMWIMLSGNDFNPEKESFDSLASKQMYMIDKIVGFQIYLKDSLGNPVYFDNTINPTIYGLSLYAVVQEDTTFKAFEFYFDCGNDAQIIVPGKKEDYKLGDLVFVRKVVSPSSINNKELWISSIESSSQALEEVAITVWDIEKSTEKLLAPLDIYNSLEYNPYLEDNGFLYKSMTSVTAKHLANQEVVIMCDGNYIGKNTVAPDGMLLLQNPATYVVIGLEYTMEVETTPLSGGSQIGSSIGGVTSQKEIVLSLYYSLGGRYGTEKDNTYTIPYKRQVQLNKPQDLFTGNLSLPVIKSKNIYERCTYLEHSEPVNFTVLSLTEETSVSDS